MVVELARTIKPRKLNVAKVRQNILNALRKEGNVVKREYEKTVATWNDPPKFEALVGLDRPPGAASVLVGPVGTELQVNKFVWTDQGTKPHVITAKNAPALVFQSGYSPATVPNRIASYPAGRFGEFVRVQSVPHPGTEPRNFTIIITNRRRKPFTQAMIAAARIEYK